MIAALAVLILYVILFGLSKLAVRVSQHAPADRELLRDWQTQAAPVREADWTAIAQLEEDTYGEVREHGRWPGIDATAPAEQRFLLGEGPPENWGPEFLHPKPEGKPGPAATPGPTRGMMAGPALTGVGAAADGEALIAKLRGERVAVRETLRYITETQGPRGLSPDQETAWEAGNKRIAELDAKITMRENGWRTLNEARYAEVTALGDRDRAYIPLQPGIGYFTCAQCDRTVPEDSRIAHAEEHRVAVLAARNALFAHEAKLKADYQLSVQLAGLQRQRQAAWEELHADAGGDVRRMRSTREFNMLLFEVERLDNAIKALLASREG